MSQVRRRCVFYVSGFDPKGAGHYHGLYKEQSALQAKAGGLAIDVGPRKRLDSGNPYWTLKASDAGGAVETHYEFMRWDDIVRAHWPKLQWHLWRDVVVTTLFYLWHGALWKMFKLSWPPAVAVFMPFVLLIAVLAGAPLVGALAGWLGWQVTAHPAGAVLAALGGAAIVIWIGLALEVRYSMYWMMRSYAFTRRQALGRTPDLEARLDAQAARLAQRLAEGIDDEVLVVGHSSGANMAASIVARALRRSPAGAKTPQLSLLTLGQWIPLYGLLPQADGFRQELAELATAPELHWIDFSAPPDGCCFALCDPVGGCGVRTSNPGAEAEHPKLLSPRFAEMFEPDAYTSLRRDKFRMHFQYLCAGEREQRYDFFAMTAGAMTLEERFSDVPGVRNYRSLRPFRSGDIS
jgi:hypothetical protein